MKRIHTVSSTIEYLQQLDLCELWPSEFCVFRGHAKSSWRLLPSLGREFKCPGDKGYDDWYMLESGLMEPFQRHSRPFLTHEPKGWLEWLVIARQHGLPSRLLDWTTNPLKALFFAVEDHDRMHGAVWALEVMMDWPTDLGVLSKEIDILVPVCPPHLDNRVVAQESCFTLFPYPTGNVPIPPLEETEEHLIKSQIPREKKQEIRLIKFQVPRERKPQIRWELRQLGITHLSLFPGLDSVASAMMTFEAVRGLRSPWETHGL